VYVTARLSVLVEGSVVSHDSPAAPRSRHRIIAGINVPSRYTV
jgi:hypothetical protein